MLEDQMTTQNVGFGEIFTCGGCYIQLIQ